MSPTIRDVARMAGVSATTASRVLSGSDHPVAAEVRRRVLEAARELDFTPNAYARGLSKGEFRIIGLVIPDILDPYFVEIARGVEDLASAEGYLVVLCNTDRQAAKERKYVEELRAMRAGVVLTGGGIDREAHLADLVSHPAPIVVIGRHELPFSSVQIDNVQGAIDATEHLIRLGHRRIAFLSGPLTSATAADRWEGFRRAMSHYGLPVDPDLVVESDFSTGGGARGLQTLAKVDPLPTALFAANDHMAIGAIREARRLGIEIPGRLSVVGFNDIASACEVDPPLSTIHLPLREIGRMAGDLLLRQIKNGRQPAAALTVRGELVVRGSTRELA